MRTPLQEQLLKAGLAKKSQVADAARELQRRHKDKVKGKPAAAEATGSVDVERLQAERAERDRAIAAGHKARAREKELQAQARQIIQAHRVPHGGEIDYGFTDGDRIRRIPVDRQQRDQLAKGGLLVVRDGDGYALLPRSAGAKLRERDPSLVVVDHADGSPGPDADGEDPFYSRFKVPDDLVW